MFPPRHRPRLFCLSRAFLHLCLPNANRPSNNFGGQEPGDNGEILNGLKYVRPGNGFVPLFDLTQKVDVNGAFTHPVWNSIKSVCPAVSNVIASTPWLTSPVSPADVAWNFETVLIDASGRPYRRYSTLIDPASILPDIQYLLSQATA